MVFSEKIRNYIHAPTGMAVGTRDAHLKPEYTRALGARVVANNSIQFFFDLKTSGRTTENIKDNGWVSIVMCHLLTIESFQFKGKCIEYRACNAEEEQYVKDYFIGLNDHGVQIGFPEEVLYQYPHSQMWSIVMDVEAVYEQTPKIGTGQLI